MLITVQDDNRFFFVCSLNTHGTSPNILTLLVQEFQSTAHSQPIAYKDNMIRRIRYSLFYRESITYMNSRRW
ncbi:MAG TPA: hypothetical protein VIX42_00460 [Edaphobacter sp.]